MTYALAPFLGALFLAPAPDLPTAPPPREVALYFPTKVGSKWVYQRGDTAVTEVVTAVEQKDGGKLVSVAREEAGKRVPVEKILVSGKGLARVGAGGNDLGYELHLLSLPITPGQKWKFGATEVTVVGFERIEVPAGTFTAVRVEKVVPLGLPVTFTYWYAPEVGVVRRMTEVGERGKGVVEVLKSFTPGKG
jgi:hypothetical protein